MVICGAISQYNHRGHVDGPTNYLNLLIKRDRMQGFLIFDDADQVPAAATEISGWLADGQIRAQEHLIEGSVTDFPDTLRALF